MTQEEVWATRAKAIAQARKARALAVSQAQETFEKDVGPLTDIPEPLRGPAWDTFRATVTLAWANWYRDLELIDADYRKATKKK